MWRKGLLLSLLAATPGLAETRFVDASDRLGPQDPADFTMDIMAVDANEDGILDLIFALEFAPNRIRLGTAAGHFEEVRDWAPDEARDSEDIVAGDMNDDGILDLIIVSEDDRIDSYWLGNGDGTFAASPTGLPVAGITNAIVAIGSDADAPPDLILGNRGPNVALGNDGRGRFSVIEGFPGGTGVTQDLALTDLNGDGQADLVEGNEGANRLLLRRGDGWQVVSNAFVGMPPGETRHVATGDVDGDGDTDLYVGNVSLFTGLDAQDRLLLNDGTGGFVDVTEDRLPADDLSTMSAALVDLDGDGDLDLVRAIFLSQDGGPARVRGLLNDGTGRFIDATDALFPPSAVARGLDVEVFDLGLSAPALAVASRGGPDLLLLPRNP